MSKQKKIAVFGGGSWATAIVKMLSENLETIGWYMRNEQAIEHIKENDHNPNYLRAADIFASQLDLSSDINYIAKNYDVLIFVIPSAFLTSELKKLETSLDHKIIVSAIASMGLFSIIPSSHHALLIFFLISSSVLWINMPEFGSDLLILLNSAPDSSFPCFFNPGSSL